MGRLTDEMTRLREEVDASYHARQEFITELQEDVESITADAVAMQTNFCNDRNDMAEKLRTDLGGFLSELKANVGDMANEFSSERMEMGKETQAEREQFVADIQAAVSSIRSEAEAVMSAFRKDHADMAANLHADLDGFSSNLQTAVDDMIVGFCNNRAEMAGETKATRQEFVNGIVQAVDDLKAKNTALIAEFAADLAGARQVWSGEVPHVPTIVPPGEEKIIVESLVKQEPVSNDDVPKAEDPIERDDLTKIKGIGSGREAQLNSGGIFNFVQLANCTIDMLNEILGADSARLAPVDKWIETAKDLVK